MHIPQKGQKMPKMVKNGNKFQKITNNCKVSEITKYGEKMTKIDKNVKQCKKMPKTGLKQPKNGQISEFCCHRFSGSKLPQKMVLAVFTRCLVPEIRIFGNCQLKSAFLGLNSSRTKEITAKPMVLSYVGHFSKHWDKNPWSVFF